MSTITTREAAEQLGVTVQMVRRMCHEEKLNARQSNRTWLINQESIDNILYAKGKDLVSENKEGLNNRKLISFFSGAMGLDLGLEKAGFTPLVCSEIDKSTRATIHKNKPNISLLGDIRNYNKEDVLRAAGLTEKDDIDIVAGGPPCQAFSTAGRRQGLEDERGNVFLKYIDLAIELNPKYIIIENVRGLLSAPLKHRPHDKRGDLFPPLKSEEEPGGVLHYILRIIRDSGYSYSFNLYNAANFGVAQSRERVVIICSRDGTTVPFLEPTHSNDQSYQLPPWVTFRQAVDGIQEEHEHVNFPEKRLKYYSLLGPGQYWKHLPLELQKEALGKSFYSGGGKTGFLRRVAWDKPSPTLVTHPAMPATDLAHPEYNRPLSVQEYKRLQQFPDSWILEGRILDKYKQLGNAVPVGLGYSIGKAILGHMEKRVTSNFTGFKFSRYKNTSHVDFEKKFTSEVNQSELF